MIASLVGRGEELPSPNPPIEAAQLGDETDER
jgi:hypothetical protein